MHLEELAAKVASLLRPARFLIAPEPATPAAGSAVMYAEDAAGVARLRVKHSTGSNLALFRDAVSRCKNTSGVALAAGDVVYVTGSTGNFPTVAKARADAAATMPAFGLCVAAAADNAFVTVQHSGIVGGLDTSALVEGDILFVSAATAGAVTTTEPQHPNLSQAIGVVTKSNAGAGQIHVQVAPGHEGDNFGTARSTWNVGPASGAAAVTVAFKNANTGNLQWTPTGARTLTLPDTTATLATVGGNLGASTGTTHAVTSYLKTGTTTVGALPAAATAGAGARHFVTDANATTFNSVVAGGGANSVPVFSDGANWRIG